MAFSKAKLLRFNDIKSCAPPPGAYNPKYDESVVGSVISSCGRFVEPRSPATSTCSESHSVCSTSSVPNFRTPTIPNVKKIISSSAEKKGISKSLFSPMKSEALREKIVECMNKDITIKELESQIEEMKSLINCLKAERSLITQEKDRLIIDIEFERKSNEEKLIKLKEQYDSKIASLTCQLSQAEQEHMNVVSNCEAQKAELKAQNVAEMISLTKNLDLLETHIAETVKERESCLKVIEEKLNQSEATCNSLQAEIFIKCDELFILKSQLRESEEEKAELDENHASEIKSLNKLHTSEVQDLEYEMLKISTEWRKVIDNIEQENSRKINELQHHKLSELNAVQDNCTKQMIDLKMLTDARIRQAEENCSEKMKLAEIQMEEKRKELETDWVMKLKQQQDKANEILQECQSISEYSIIQCELEKNDISNRLREEKENVLSENSKLERIINNLKSDMSAIIIELNDTREQLGKEIELHNSDLERALVQKHNYEITLIKTHETVNALKNRLLNSDRDVEQLKSSIETIENELVHSENKCMLVSEKLEEQVHKNQLFTSSLQDHSLEEELNEKMKIMEYELLKKVQELQIKADVRISELSKIADAKSVDLSNAMDQLHDQQALVAQAQTTLHNAENEIDRLNMENNELNVKLREKHFCSTGEEMLKMELEIKDKEIHALMKMIKDQDVLIGPFREQLENYEREFKLLLVHKNEAEQETKEMHLKYAEILGHQNKKQKIKYMVDLKKRNIELQEKKSECEAKLYKQTLLIDKLKYEVTKLNHKNDKKQKRRSRSLISNDKENMCSPVKNQINNNSFKLDSPLKERN